MSIHVCVWVHCTCVWYICVCACSTRMCMCVPVCQCRYPKRAPESCSITLRLVPLIRGLCLKLKLTPETPCLCPPLHNAGVVGKGHCIQLFFFLTCILGIWSQALKLVQQMFLLAESSLQPQFYLEVWALIVGASSDITLQMPYLISTPSLSHQYLMPLAGLSSSPLYFGSRDSALAWFFSLPEQSAPVLSAAFTLIS